MISVFEKFRAKLTTFRRRAKNRFPGTADYWEKRYAGGKTSGPGSYNRLANFKAEFLNSFVTDNGIRSVIELGCGDGNQLSLANYPSYIGLDVSISAIRMCIERFKNDLTKSFYYYDNSAFCDNHKLFSAELAISLDVLYHLVEDEIWESYLNQLFDSSERFVIIYSSDTNEEPSHHIRRRTFTNWVEEMLPGWDLSEIIENRYPFEEDNQDLTSKSDFYVFRRKGVP